VKIGDLARFVSYLNGLIEDNVIHLSRGDNNKRSARTINHIVTAVSSFYQYHHRMGTVEEISLVQWKKSYSGLRDFKPLLHHLSKSKKKGTSILKLKEKKSICKVVEINVIKKMVESCRHIQDKLLICLLYETGCRIGQALGLRHTDVYFLNNFARGSKVANVGKPWLYKEKSIRKKIEILRKQIGLIKGSPQDISSAASNKSKDNIVKMLKERIAKLETENTKLKKQVEVLYGELYQKRAVEEN